MDGKTSCSTQCAAAPRRASLSAALKSEFLTNMRHEIRTPMNGIMGTCELIMETRLNGEQSEYGSTILNSARALLEIITTHSMYERSNRAAWRSTPNPSICGSYWKM